MTKQFTIPCQFGQQTSPVTFYIGHPDSGHHPIHFQSTWLSSSKGGTVPQDLMNTLQQLHDLSIQNNADFEELCYYALITATTKAIDSGVSPDDIKHYANEYIEKENNISNGIVAEQTLQENISESNTTDTSNAQTETIERPENNTIIKETTTDNKLNTSFDDDLFFDSNDENLLMNDGDINVNTDNNDDETMTSSDELLQDEEDLLMDDDLFDIKDDGNENIKPQVEIDDDLIATNLDDDFVANDNEEQETDNE